jgi:CelD/BcsL family acetyltransferase involved in cellulose biosynthesis
MLNQFRLHQIHSIDALRAAAAEWNDLWERSAATSPTARAELIALWSDHFAPEASFHALVVEHDGRWVAALPLVGARLKRVIPAGARPSNPWCTAGELLLDTEVSAKPALEALVHGFEQLPWEMVRLEEVPTAEPHWEAFVAALRRNGFVVSAREQYRIGRVAIAPEWESYERGLDKKHRRNRKSQARRLEQAGETQLQIIRHASPDESEFLLREGFAVEARSWKGAAGTAVLQNPTAFHFYREQARLLAARGELELAFLEHDGRPIAFNYGYCARGVHYALKVGYDAAFQAYGPGHQLFLRMLRRFHDDQSHRLVDFCGPLDRWLADWATDSYPVDRLLIARPNRLSHGLLSTYQALYPRLTQLRDTFRAWNARLLPGRTGTVLAEETSAALGLPAGGASPGIGD